ncbi:MAG: hypothetical protein E8D41_10800 [Nitrospira sp.]|nr:MAG: hypothetical protein E8D41_10800 [Nitrospira sp.]
MKIDEAARFVVCAVIIAKQPPSIQRKVPLHEESNADSATRQVKDDSLEALAALPAAHNLDSTVGLIQALIPLGLHAVADTLDAEVTALARERYSRIGRQRGLVRWSCQQGSVYLADQKLPVTYTRVRDLPGRQKAPLQTYERVRPPWAADAGLFGKVLQR